MTLADTAHGSDWILWASLLSCNFDHCFTKWSCSKFISGYNTASKEEKARYDEKAVPCIRNWNGRDRYSPSDNRTI